MSILLLKLSKTPLSLQEEEEDMPPHFHVIKAALRQGLAEEREDDWLACRARLETRPARELANPLLACLPLGGRATRRAAAALGRAVARLAEEDSLENARIVVRRLMWQMNEESGNIGWGVPEAFAEILACQPRLAEEFHRILLSYVRKTGRDDNYCDHAVLRRSCFRAAGRLAQARPDLAAAGRDALLAGLADEDAGCRQEAAEALRILDQAGGGPHRRGYGQCAPCNATGREKTALRQAGS